MVWSGGGAASMREIYSWVPWFRELSRKIADGGGQSLAARARQVPWREDGGDPPLVRFGDEHIDPFSFIYSLASYARYAPGRKRVFKGVEKEFGLPCPLHLDAEEEFIFPQPQPNAALFNDSGRGDPKVLWRLFRSAVKGIDSVAAEDFNRAQEIGYVKITKVTQALFLVNPDDFLPYDDAIHSLGIADPSPGNTVKWETYRKDLEKIRSLFPGCSPYEISLLAYECGKSSNPLRVNPDRCFQVSTNVHNDKEDRWEDFSSNNWAYTGGPGIAGVSWEDYERDGGKEQYPLKEPRPGDILLVRFTKTGHGIGIVYRNDYAQQLRAGARPGVFNV